MMMMIMMVMMETRKKLMCGSSTSLNRHQCSGMRTRAGAGGSPDQGHRRETSGTWSDGAEDEGHGLLGAERVKSEPKLKRRRSNGEGCKLEERASKKPWL